VRVVSVGNDFGALLLLGVVVVRVSDENDHLPWQARDTHTRARARETSLLRTVFYVFKPGPTGWSHTPRNSCSRGGVS
jgi:hypothetical protein